MGHSNLQLPNPNKHSVMRLLSIHERFGSLGGAEVNILLIAQELQRRGHDVGMAYGGADSGDAEWRDAFASRFSLDESAGIGALDRALTQFKPDVVVLHKFSEPRALDALASCPSPVVRMVHDHDLYCMRSYKYNYLTRRICTRAASAYCVFSCGAVVGRAVGDFVRRNVAKAQLACGDALLAAHRQYHWSCRERHRRQEGLARAMRPAWFDAALRHHAVGVGFKLHPQADAISRDSLVAAHDEITALAMKCWLWLEARRLGRAYPSARAYAEDPRDVCPGTPPFLNILLNLRADGFRLRSKPRPWRHPRQRLLRLLPLLLWEPGAIDEPALKRLIQSQLNARASIPSECVAAYRALWQGVR